MTNSKLATIVEHIERLNQEKADLSADITELYAEAKDDGYDPKIVREVIRVRKMDADARADMSAMVETYLTELGGA